jgi:predicted nucleotidyltransferase
MKYGLPDAVVESICQALTHHPRVNKAVLFGSRAMNRHSARSDVDLALSGDLDALEVEGIALTLDDLPLPFRFDLQLDAVHYPPLREHIARVGKIIYSKEEQ